MTYDQALDAIPATAEWSCSFGNPGCGGFTEVYRTPHGQRFEISNGAYDERAPFVWTAKEVS